MPNSQVGLHALRRAGIIVSGNGGKDEAFSAAEVMNGFTLWQVHGIGIQSLTEIGKLNGKTWRPPASSSAGRKFSLLQENWQAEIKRVFDVLWSLEDPGARFLTHQTSGCHIPVANGTRSCVCVLQKRDSSSRPLSSARSTKCMPQTESALLRKSQTNIGVVCCHGFGS
jgi:hypothetical protein